MTDAERAVLDAARALVPEIECAAETTGYEPSAKAGALITAVRALPRPLSEQLAELRVGAVVECGDERAIVRVLALVPDLDEFCGRWAAPEGGRDFIGALPMRSIRRIISNPEADRG